MRKEYPSDISRKQFEIIREDLKNVRKTTHPSTYDLYDIFCAVLYLLKEGCTRQQIADAVGCHINTVDNVLKEYKQEIKQETDNTDDTKKLKCKSGQKDIKKSTIELYK